MIINKTGLTFAGKVWQEGEFVDPNINGFPFHLINTEWFQRCPIEDVVIADDKPDKYICNLCSKEYSRKDFYEKHISKCEG